MDEEENKIKERKERVKIWLKNKYNFIFLALFIFIFIYKLYWFFKVGNQPLWFDEADYMSTAKSWLGIANYAFNPLRPVLFTLFAYFIFKIGLGETALRFAILLISVSSVPLIYLIASRFFDKRIGLVSAFIMGIFWSWTFYTYRLLVDVPLGIIWLVTIYLFFDAYFGNKSWKSYLLAGIFLGLSFLMKFSSVTLVLIFAIYLLTTEKLSVFKNKNIWVFFVSSLVTILPYFIWQKIKFGSPIAFYTVARSSASSQTRSFLESLVSQILFSFGLLGSFLVIILVLGVIHLTYELSLMRDKSAQKNTRANIDYFIFLWVLFSLLFFGWLNYGAYMDERYYFIFYPALFIIASKFIIRMYDLVKKYSKYISIAVVIVLLFSAAYQNNAMAKNTIENKINSFILPKDVGVWVKANTYPGEKVISTQENPEIQYYAEREIAGTWAFNSSEELEAFIEQENVNYIILAIFYPQNIKQWEYEYFSNNARLIPVKSYTPYIDQEQKIPIITIFKIQKKEVGRATF